MPTEQSTPHGLPSDSQLPGFGTALDAGQMSALLRPHLHSAGFSLQELRLDRFRYRAGRRAVAVYAVETRECTTGDVRRTFLAGRIHADRPAKGAPKAVGPPATGCLPARFQLPEIGMQIEVFPCDRRLPELADFVGNPSARGMTFLRSALDRPDLTAADVCARPVRYRAGLSATLECRVKGADGSDDTVCFVKITSGEEIRQCDDAAERVAAAMATIDPSIQIALPAASLHRGRLALFRQAGGETLASIVERDAPFDDAAERSARMLGALHRAAIDGLPQTFDDDVTDKIDRAIALISWACPELAGRLADVERLARRCLRTNVRAPTHRDMKPDHIFIATDRIALIDNGSICLGNPVTDLGALEARLGLLSSRRAVPRERVTALIDAIRDAYFEHVQPSWRSLLPAARAYGALLVSTHVIQSLAPGWRSIVEEKLRSALA